MLLSSVPLPAVAQEGGLRFRGQVVNASCEISQASAGMLAGQRQRLQVSPGVVLEVSTVQNACSTGVLPISTAFVPLTGQGAPAGISRSAGVVTITYQ